MSNLNQKHVRYLMKLNFVTVLLKSATHSKSRVILNDPKLPVSLTSINKQRFILHQFVLQRCEEHDAVYSTTCNFYTY
jgi:hypothetical protein